MQANSNNYLPQEDFSFFLKPDTDSHSQSKASSGITFSKAFNKNTLLGGATLSNSNKSVNSES